MHTYTSKEQDKPTVPANEKNISIYICEMLVDIIKQYESNINKTNKK